MFYMNYLKDIFDQSTLNKIAPFSQYYWLKLFLLKPIINQVHIIYIYVFMYSLTK